MSKQYSVRQIENMLNENGYKLLRIKGSHAIYGKEERILVVPLVNLNFKVGNKIAKQCLL